MQSAEIDTNHECEREGGHIKLSQRNMSGHEINFFGKEPSSS